MSVLIAEQVYQYPLRRRFWRSIIGSLLIGISLLGAGYQLLRGLVTVSEPFALWMRRTPGLRSVYDWLSPLPVDLQAWLPEAFVGLLWAAAGLVVALVLLNALPAIRVSPRGLLIEFAGGWLPVAWEDLQTIHVTSDQAGQRFVLLVIPTKTAKRLTGWHRLYGLIYGATLRPSFLISSAIENFDHLLNTIVQENSRAIRGIEGAQPVVIDEQHRSWLFSLFLRGATTTEPLPTDVSLPPLSEPDVRAVLPVFSPVRLGQLALILLMLGAGLWHYRSYWDRALTLLFPDLRSHPSFLWVSQYSPYNAIFNVYQGVSVPLFGFPDRPDLPAPIWLLIAAQCMLAMMIIAVAILCVAMPLAATTGQEGIKLRFLPRPLPAERSIPWSQISALKVIDLGFSRNVAFVQSSRLPWLCHLIGLIVCSRWIPGTLLIGAMRNFPELIERCAERLSHLPPVNDTPRFQPTAFAPNLQLIGQPVATISALEAELKTTSGSTASLLWAAGRAMFLVSLPLGLMFFIPGVIDGDRWPGWGAIVGGIGFTLAGLLEWPLIVLISIIIHGDLANDQHQSHIFAFYPLAQMPRMLFMLLAVGFIIVNLPWLAAIAWLASLALAYWTTAALWVRVYEWDGTQAIAGGLMPVFWQMFVMLTFWSLF
ncbi:hypothetical protein [Chloroflexus sp.]|uniref:hypothetical protein n=1 Tax=Chloroflexus sp. TaxID=1904827 RepID=UPI002637BB15|nr:hypothetical protein [uncultured Chloroflexus sp.]